jgi:hypothetical protein
MRKAEVRPAKNPALKAQSEIAATQYSLATIINAHTSQSINSPIDAEFWEYRNIPDPPKFENPKTSSNQTKSSAIRSISSVKQEDFSLSQLLISYQPLFSSSLYLWEY